MREYEIMMVQLSCAHVLTFDAESAKYFVLFSIAFLLCWRVYITDI